MFRRGRHRAPRQCADHLGELTRIRRDLQWFKDQCSALNKETDHLRAQIKMLQKELGSEDPTKPLPVAELRARMAAQAPAMIKARTVEGFTIMLPVGNRRTRRVRPVPSWALRE